VVDDTAFTTRQVAAFCGVSAVAVWKWIKAGKLAASRLPNGHYRVDRDVLRAFMLDRGLPLPDELVEAAPRRILIVDNERDAVDVMARALRRLGDQVELATAEDGFSAGLQLATFRPHLILLDLMMPAIDGFEICRLVRNTPASAHCKILVVTAYGSHENLDRALDVGADDFLLKPIDIDDLTHRVSDLLDMS
jgi:excisionase family DNA binding protein